jgi:sensor histidine kinase YesM
LYAYRSERQRFEELQGEREMDRLRMQKSEVDLRLTVLQAQVEPHFLFNTLASVHSLIRKDPQRAEATVEALVDHLRATLPKLRQGVGSQHSTLAEQIEVCTSYLAVMKVRMGERLRYDIDVPQALLSHPFPPLMLISLVENAIKHGIEPSTDGGSITIRATEVREGDLKDIAVSVIDQGVGLRPGLGDGMGLANLRAQLTAQFGARGRFSISGGTEGGTVATMIVPYVEAAS